MARRSKQEPTFTTIVRDAKLARSRVPDDAAFDRGKQADGFFVDQMGRRYRLAEPSIDAAEAQRCASRGAAIVSDP